MKPFLLVRRARFPLIVASSLAVALAIFSPVPQEASANPDCEAFAHTPELVNGQVGSNGGAHCTSTGTGLFRVDVILYQDGWEAGRAAETCHGEQQCGIRVVVDDEEGDQQWCAMTVGVYTGAGLEGSGGGPRTEMICENAAF
jgi:hypothetical protein